MEAPHVRYGVRSPLPCSECGTECRFSHLDAHLRGALRRGSAQQHQNQQLHGLGAACCIRRDICGTRACLQQWRGCSRRFACWSDARLRR